ncbi:holotricin-3-like [Trichoplusia ni]|uniref:Holotricin-3-like n=1 Tax=Trichoplusia ni TaxID=7111 RepID=A0A7E5VTZ2_TRINI|nr:holotricin-3-like [Trichoplusia ni]
MARLFLFVLVLAIVSCVFALPGQKHYSGQAHASHGSIGVGSVSGGDFGAGAFSIGHGGSSSGYGTGGQGGSHGSNHYGR